MIYQKLNVRVALKLWDTVCSIDFDWSITIRGHFWPEHKYVYEESYTFESNTLLHMLLVK